MSQGQVGRAVRSEIEVGTMSLHGTVTDRGDGRCSVNVAYRDRVTTNNQRMEFRFVHRQSLADLLRVLADEISPQEGGGAYNLWCELHFADLDGEPQWTRDVHAGAWELSLAGMHCPHAGDGVACRGAWRVGAIAVSRNERGS